MHGNAMRTRAQVVDARSIQIECPEHRGLLLPVTDIKISHSNNVDKPGGTKTLKIYMEALCKYCDKYHYVEVKAWSVAWLPPLHE